MKGHTVFAGVCVFLILLLLFIAIFALPNKLEYGGKGVYRYNLLGSESYLIECNMTSEEAHRVLDELIKFREEYRHVGG